MNRISSLNKHLQRLSHQLNHYTGYDAIQHLKARVLQHEQAYAHHRQSLKRLQSDYATLMTTRTQTQRDINTLLQRKHQWTPHDVQHFTQLYAQEHALDQQAHHLTQDLQQAEAQAEEQHDLLMDAIRERYREEQLWSDQVRSVSAYGTLVLVLVNAIMFILVHAWLEPRRRGLMMEQVEELLEERMMNMQSVQGTDERVWSEMKRLADLLEAAPKQVHDSSTMTLPVESAVLVEAKEPPVVVTPPVVNKQRAKPWPRWLEAATAILGSGLVGGITAYLST